MYSELLWIFTQLSDDYIVIDTETTGLPDENGLPDIVTLGITIVRDRELAESVAFKTRPQQRISEEAQSIHGVTDEQAARFELFDSQWHHISAYLKDQLVVIHNASLTGPSCWIAWRDLTWQCRQLKGYFVTRKQLYPGHRQ